MKITDPMQYLRHRASENDPDWNVEGFVLEHGKTFEQVELTAEEQALVDATIAMFHSVYGKFERRQCFSNAQRLLKCDPSALLYYVEGYAITEGVVLPALHGWLSINNKVVDVTLPAFMGSRRGEEDEPLQGRGVIKGRAYLGVTFLREYVEARIHATGQTAGLLDDHQNHRPVLQCGGVGATVPAARVSQEPCP